jgi:hypothetical protein
MTPIIIDATPSISSVITGGPLPSEYDGDEVLAIHWARGTYAARALADRDRIELIEPAALPPLAAKLGFTRAFRSSGGGEKFIVALNPDGTRAWLDRAP